ncbi:unnamed protein product [Parascedosporium putredinis]|uniref:aspartate--tRNA ligase n=1 Tax=Parascedosporium putredinis TaxID=1442378 RepID=A0A9P1GVF0_9PEZI|nr:unnamed protein product [Parascedosporium putredinis]CAI7988080.1 unnamed protein product [Parascedosporium putredinis]
MADPAPSDPKPAAAAPAEDAGAEGAGPSKKAAKKAEAKAKKEAEKARKAAEREAAAAAAKAASGPAEDLAKENYGDITPSTKVEAERVHLRDLGEKHLDKVIRLRAWIQNSRLQGAKMAFVELREERDWSIQGVMVATAEGTPCPNRCCKVSDYELHITKCYLVSRDLLYSDASADAGKAVEEGVAALAIDSMPNASLSTHLNNPAMHKRAPVQQAIADVRMTVRKLFGDYLEARGFPSCLPSSIPQFYKQFEIAGGRKRVYCIGPVFRAENSNTPRHMTEFTGLDLEMEIEDHYHEVRDMLEGVLLHIFRGIQEKCAEQVELVRSVYPSEDFLLPEPGKEVRLTFAEGQKLLREEGPEEYRNVSDDEDMSTPQEKALGALIREKYKTDFYVLDKFPESARPFYTIEDPENPKVTNAYDFFMRGQEILSGGQRIHIPTTLEARIRRKGIDPNSPGIKEYVDVFRSAGVPLTAVVVSAWTVSLPGTSTSPVYISRATTPEHPSASSLKNEI